MRPSVSIAAGILGVVAVGVAMWFLDPVTTSLFPACMFHQLTGLQCPGCGSSRALHALVHGDLRAAFGFNPLLWILLPLVIYGLAKPTGLARLRPGWVWAVLGMIILFSVARNIPAHPFTMLAP